MVDNSGTTYGYMGSILHVDLTAKRYREAPLNPQYADLLLGGRGFGIAYLFQHFHGLAHKYSNPFKDVDPLSEDNVIVISTSATTATKVPTSGRLHMSFKSPLTDALGSTNGGGHFSVGLKRTGFDVLVITGKSAAPCMLVISSGRVTFEDVAEPDEPNSILLRKKIRKNKLMWALGTSLVILVLAAGAFGGSTR